MVVNNACYALVRITHHVAVGVVGKIITYVGAIFKTVGVVGVLGVNCRYTATSFDFENTLFF